MKITPFLFEAHLKCPTQCWRRAQGENGDDNAYASESVIRLASSIYRSGDVASAPEPAALKAAEWLLTVV